MSSYHIWWYPHKINRHQLHSLSSPTLTEYMSEYVDVCWWEVRDKEVVPKRTETIQQGTGPDIK